MQESNLPDELLIQIFFILREYGSILSSWDWIIVTHVCRRWRRIAVDYPSLWAFPDFSYHSEDRLEAFLSRSGHVPVIIDGRHRAGDDSDELNKIDNGYYTKCGALVELALKKNISLKRLLLENFSVDVLNCINSIQVSNLKELDLTLRDRDIPPIRLQNAIFNETIPTLRVLNLKGYMISSNSFLLRGLKQLIIMDNHSAINAFNICSVFYPSVDDFLSILEGCPNLEVLKLKYLKKPTSSISQVRQRLSMPFLQYLTLDQLDVCVADTIAECVHFPGLLDLDLGLRYPIGQEIAGIMSVIRRIVKDASHDDIIVSFMPYLVILEAHAGTDDAVIDSAVISFYPIDESGMSLSIQEADKIVFIEILTELFRETQQWNPIMLTLEFLDSFCCDYLLWSSLFHAIPNLETLCLSLEYPDSYIGRIAMIQTNHHLFDAITDPSILPNLEDFTLEGIDVGTLQYYLTIYLQMIQECGRSLELVLKHCKDRSWDERWLNSEHFDGIDISWDDSASESEA